MATLDTIIDTWIDSPGDDKHTVRRTLPQFNLEVVQISASTWYIIYLKNRADAGLTDQIGYQKTTDTGATWSAFTVFENADLNGGVAIWFDKWTNGDTGTEIHVFVTDSTPATDEQLYYSLDTADDSITGPIVIATDSTNSVRHVALTKSRGGDLYARMSASTHKMYRGVSPYAVSDWSAIALPETGTAADVCLLQPGAESDNNDIWAFYWDNSANEVSLYVYDQSADSWSETSIETSVDFTGTATAASLGDAADMMCAIHRHSDNHSLLFYHTDPDTSTSDLRCWDVASAASITAKADVLTDIDASWHVRATIDNNNTDLYVWWLTSDSNLANTYGDVPIQYKKSTDDGANWLTAVAVNNSLKDDARGVYVAPHIDNFGTPHAVWLMESLAELHSDDGVSDSVGSSYALTDSLPVVESVSYRTEDSGEIIIERPRGCNIGDLMLAFIFGHFTVSSTQDLTVPSGWTLVHALQGSATVFAPHLICYKIVESGEADTHTFTQTGTSTTMAGVIVRVSNVNPVAVGAFAFDSDSLGTPDVPAINTLGRNSLVFRGGFTRNPVTWVNPTSHFADYVRLRGPSAGAAGFVMGHIPATTPQTLAAENDALGGITGIGHGFSLEINRGVRVVGAGNLVPKMVAAGFI